MSFRRTNSKLLFVGLVGGIVVLGLIAWLAHHRTEPGHPKWVSPATSPTTKSSTAIAPTNSVHLLDGSNGLLKAAYELLRTSSDAKTVRLELAELRRSLSAMPTNAAVAAVRQFLDSKMDTSTHVAFKVGANGLLDEAPTLRTFLLDELARLDPAAAADYSKVVLASMDSPDEWAVALRNLARGDTSATGRALLQEKTSALLQYAPWQRNPSVGYLEAFDAAVFAGGTGLLPDLSNLLRNQDNPAVAHASFLAMDRLVINDPATTLSAFLAAPDLMQGRESTRANFFARADVRDPQQRQILENYLRDSHIGAQELTEFAGLFPNANFMISQNLLTSNSTLSREALVSRDAESLRVVEGWLADPRYAKWAPQFQKIRLRLGQFVQQASQGQ